MEENNHIDTEVVAPEDGTVTEDKTEEKELPVKSEPMELIDKIKDTDSLNEFLPLFNLSIAKKQAMRVTKREEVLDMVTDRIKERLEKRPEELTITELNAIDKTMSEQKQKELGLVNAVNDTPAINVTQNNNIIMMGDNSNIDRESKDRVIDAVREILKMAQSSPINTTEVKVVDVETPEAEEK